MRTRKNKGQRDETEICNLVKIISYKATMASSMHNKILSSRGRNKQQNEKFQSNSKNEGGKH
jgi:hypothetical protein